MLVVLGNLVLSATESWNNATCRSVLIAVSFSPPLTIKELLMDFDDNCYWLVLLEVLIITANMFQIDE